MKASEQIQKLKDEMSALQARVDEFEAQAAAMREALQASEHFEALIRGAEHALSTRDPEVAAAYRAEAERARGEAVRLRHAALAPDAGRQWFDRLLRMEQEYKELKTLLLAIAKQSGGSVRVARQTMMAISPDADIEISSSDYMHTETIVQLVEKGAARS